MATELTAVQIKGALTAKYPRPEWASLCELDEYTSAGHGCRRIDFFAVSCYASKGWRTVACEVKVNRADWIKEAQDPGKRAGFEALSCEFWYVSPPDVIRVDEVPASCGLYHVTAGLTFRTMKVAPYTQIESLPLPFVAALLRRATDDVPCVPRAAWKREGQEIGAEELMDLVKDVYGKASHRYFEETRKSAPTTEEAVWQDFGRRVGSLMGRYGAEAPSRAEFEQWLTERGRMVPLLSNRLRELYGTISDLLGEAGG